MSRRRSFALPAILTCIAALWIGVAWIDINADDYQYIESMAPIHSALDVLRPFVSHDANPSYFRPLANASLALDFLIFHWFGGAYHLTNLLLHLLACGLIYPFAREVFGLTRRQALASVFVFGLLASHEYNLVVDTARADVLVAIFSVVAVIALVRGKAGRTKREDGLTWKAISLASFALALLSKEIAVMLLAFLPVLSIQPGERILPTLKRIASDLMPYLAVAILFYWYHSQFTVAVSDSAPLAQVSSLASMLRNAAYALGYVILPLDLATATAVLSHGMLVAILVGLVLFLSIGIAIYRTHAREDYLALALPAYFTIVTGSIVLLTFERWRVYLPSAGLVLLGTVIVSRILAGSKQYAKVAVILLVAALAVFHFNRILIAQAEWRVSTRLLTKLRGDIQTVLEESPRRPATLGFVTSPTKLGSASVIQLGLGAIVRRAEMDRIAPDRVDGSVSDAHVNARSCVELYALDRGEGYRGLQVQRTGARTFAVSADSASALMLVPNGIENGGVARRDVVLKVGDTVATDFSVSVTRTVDGRMIHAVDVQMLDTTAVPVYFDGHTIKRFE